MRKWKTSLLALLAAGLIWGGLRAAEITDLDTTDANNTGTAANAGFPENMPPSDVNNAARALEGILARWHKDWDGSLSDYSAAANSVKVTPNRTISALANGHTFAIDVTTANTGATTLAIGALTAKNILKSRDQALASGDLEAGSQILVVYNAQQDAFQLLSGLANAPSTYTDPITTRGDLVRGDSSGNSERLAVGTADQVVITDGTDTSWSKLTFANIGDNEDGELITWNSSGNAAGVATGTSGQVLTSNGAGAAPTFQAAAAGGKLSAVGSITHTSDTALATQAAGGSQMGSAVSLSIPTAGAVRVTVLTMEVDETEGGNSAAGIAIKIGTDSLLWASADNEAGTLEYMVVAEPDASVTGSIQGPGGWGNSIGSISMPMVFTWDIVGNSMSTGSQDVEVWLGDNVVSQTGEITVTGTTRTARFLVEVVDGT